MSLHRSLFSRRDTRIGLNFRLLMVIFIISMYSPQTLLSKEIANSKFMDTTGKFAGDYLCIADVSSGFSYNKTLKKWEEAQFNIKQDRVIFRISTIGISIRHSEILGDERVMDYQVETSTPDDKRAIRCTNHRYGNLSLSNSGFFSCSSSLMDYYVNLDSMRYMKIYRTGFIDGVDDNSNTPHMTIGRCSHF